MTNLFSNEQSSVVAFCSLNPSTSSAREDKKNEHWDLRDPSRLAALKILFVIGRARDLLCWISSSKVDF